MRFFILFPVLILGLQITAPAQNRKKSISEADFEETIQELFAQQDDDLNYTDLYESLFQFYTQPINLNKTGADELRSLYILSESQIQSLLRHISQTGKLLSVYELQAVQGFDLLTISRLLPFITIRESTFQQDNRSIFKRILAEKKNRYLLLRYDRTLEEKQGYTIKPGDTTASGRPRSYYLGSPYKLYARFRVSHTNDFSLGFTLEKDQGEQIIWNPETRRFGADFLSYHAVIYNQGRFRAIALGDYQLQIGQGLLLAGGFSVGKGSESINTVRRNTLGIRPYTSVLESGFFRGAATTYNFGRFDLTGFYSQTRRDANILSPEDSLSDYNEYISAIQQTGFHRTAREIAAKQQIREQVLGSHLNYKSRDKNLQLGFTFLNTHYSLPLFRNPNTYNQYEFSGKHNFNFGTNFDYNWRNFSFFGEGAVSRSGGVGFVGGVMTSVAKSVQLAFLYRNYDRDFHSFYGASFGEGTRAINESGLYWGLKIKPNKQWIFTAYYDRFRFPWLRFQTDSPSGGYETLGRLTYRPTRKISMYIHFREEVRAENWRNESLNMNVVLPYKRRNYLVNFDFKAEEIFSMRSRIQFSTYEHHLNFSRGYAIIQDANFDFGKVRLSTRFTLFDTDDYENRQYAYEKDVLYVFYVPAYYGEGFRNFYLIQFRFKRKIDLWVKYAYTQYRNQKGISSGLEQIPGNRRTDLRVQLRFKF